MGTLFARWPPPRAWLLSLSHSSDQEKTKSSCFAIAQSMSPRKNCLCSGGLPAAKVFLASKTHREKENSPIHVPGVPPLVMIFQPRAARPGNLAEYGFW